MLLLWLRASAEGRVAGSLAGVLLAVVHLLLELLCLLLVDKAQRSQTVLEVEGMEESTVLVIAPSVKNLLVPDYSAA